MATDASDSEATADEELQDAVEEQAAPAGSDYAPDAQSEEEAEADEEAETETETESEEDTKPARGRGGKAAPSRRSRASSPEPVAGSVLRLTARQRSRMQKEAGLAEDVQWHEMTLPSELAYNWKGDKRYKSAHLLSEEEWLKRQEALERRRMRSIRDKREAEESVKAKIRKAVTAKFRGKLLGPEPSGTEGDGAGGEAGGTEQEMPVIRPGWVRVVRTPTGTRVTWPARAPALALPAAVAAAPAPGDPVDLPLQPCSGGWSVPSSSEGSFKLGASLSLQLGAAAAGHMHAGGSAHTGKRQRSEAGRERQQQQLLLFVDEHNWHVGCLEQQAVLDALLAAGHMHVQQQQHQQQEQVQQQQLGSSEPWQQWRAVVRSIRRGEGHLQGVTVRLIAAPPAAG